MKIALLRPPIIYGASSASRVFSPGGYLTSRIYAEWFIRYAPLGLMYYAALLQKAGHTIKLIDGELSGYTDDTVTKLLYAFQPDIICSTVNIYNPKHEFDMLKKLKDLLACKVIARGHFPNLYPEETIKNRHIDIALTGKGFTNIVAVVNAIESQTALKNIPGIIFQSFSGDIIKTHPEQPFNFDTLPFPARNAINPKLYSTALTRSDAFTSMVTSIGCPYQCTYCIDKTIPYVEKSVPYIIEEIKECLHTYAIKEITFLDSTFTLNKERTLALCRAILDNNLKFQWTIRTRADLVDDEILDALKAAGCISIHYGIESGDPDIVTKLQRKLTLEQIKKAVCSTAERGIETLGFFIIGNDGDTEESIQRTIKFALQLPLSFAQFNIAFPIPPSKIFLDGTKKLNVDLWLESYRGADIPRDWWKPQNTAVSMERLTYWAKKAHRSFYYRPRFILKTLQSKDAYQIIRRQIKTLLLLLQQYIVYKVLRLS